MGTLERALLVSLSLLYANTKAAMTLKVTNPPSPDPSTAEAISPKLKTSPAISISSTLNTTSLSLEKRSSSYRCPWNEICPTGFSHKSSRCTGPGVDAQLFWGTCTADDEPDQMVFTSSCTGNEVCTEIQYDEAQYMVCCVAIDFDDYLTVNGEAARFGISAAEMWMRQRYLAAVAVFMFWGTDSGGGGILGRDNTMTTVSQMRTLKASKLRIEAQEAKEMFGLTQYRTLDRGVAECDECERISLWPAPAGTTDIRVMVQVPEGTVGRLYLVPILA